MWFSEIICLKQIKELPMQYLNTLYLNTVFSEITETRSHMLHLFTPK